MRLRDRRSAAMHAAVYVAEHETMSRPTNLSVRAVLSNATSNLPTLLFACWSNTYEYLVLIRSALYQVLLQYCVAYQVPGMIVLVPKMVRVAVVRVPVTSYVGVKYS